jgi:hypothetical protein
MTRAALVLAVVSTFCLGGSLGFLGGVWFTHDHLVHERRLDWRHGRGERRGAPGPPSPRELVPHLTRLLDLTPAQADSIGAEIERTRADFADVRDSLHARIERHLTPAQRDRWRAAVRERGPGEPRGFHPDPLRADPGREGGRFR